MTGTPLKPLRAFEAAARTGSFAAAARELKVTSAAVSQQVKLLEQYWGRSLFLRQGNRLSLTEAGRTAYSPLANALAAIGDLSERMQGISRSTRFVLSAPHSVAETWLPQRLAAWIRDGGDRQLDLRIEDDPSSSTATAYTCGSSSAMCSIRIFERRSCFTTGLSLSQHQASSPVTARR